MKTWSAVLLAAVSFQVFAQQQQLTSSQMQQARDISVYLQQRDSDIRSKIDFETFLDLANEVYKYRQNRLIGLDEFLRKAKEPNTVILDSRSAAMYASKHLQGAIHLDFSDYTQLRLFELIPDNQTTILIYCNNNFLDDQVNFMSKMAIEPVRLDGNPREVTLALNIPTFINLYGYGYRNVFELADLVSVNDRRLVFEGSDAGRPTP